MNQATPPPGEHASLADRPQATAARAPRTEQVMAWLLVIVISPVLLIRAVLGWLSSRALLVREPHMTIAGQRVALYRFSGWGPFKRLAGLFNVLNGDIHLTGRQLLPVSEADEADARVSTSETDFPPGWLAPHRLKRATGISFDTEDSTLQTFYEDWHIKDSLSLLLRLPFTPALETDERQLRDTFSIFGIKIDNLRMNNALDDVFAAIKKPKRRGESPHKIAFVNADCLNQAYTDGDYFNTLQQFERIYPDGIGVRLAAKMLGDAVVENVNGTDLFALLCERAAKSGTRLYLLGARQGVAEVVAEKMQARFPDLTIAGTQHGYFAEDDTEQVIAAINQSKTDILCVAFGVPRQENWLIEHQSALKVPVAIGLGGCFDFYAERIPRAPLWLREMGLEWTYRLAQEPGRMWRRYILGNPLFLFRMWRLGKHRMRAHKVTQYQTNRLINHLEEFDVASQHRWRYKRELKRFFWVLTIGVSKAVKRLIDILASGLGMLVLSPLFLGVALAIRLESKGPVFYSQQRVGKYGSQFKFWKFRSMYPDADKRQAEMMASTNEMQGGVIFKMKRDPRVTKIGYWIRKFSIDELPQLWNVFIGDMSLVGPRPALPSEVEEYALDDRDRLAIAPGITCIWQVSGRSDIPFDQQVKLDRQYIQSQSVWQDILILLKTIPAVLTGKGAY